MNKKERNLLIDPVGTAKCATKQGCKTGTHRCVNGDCCLFLLP